jgi:sugar (pentulose or hexulose) kinase
MVAYDPDVAGLTGLADDTTGSIAGHDHMCGSVAVSLNNENQILNSTGTTEGLLVVTEAVNNSKAFSVLGSLTASMFARAAFSVCLATFGWLRH